MYIGYNIDKINDLQEQIIEAGRSATKELISEFGTLKAVLRANWVGYDEQDFEKKMVGRINTLSLEIKKMVWSSVGVIRDLGYSWADFQDSNILKENSDATLGMAQQLKEKITNYDEVADIIWNLSVTHEPLEFDSSTDFGLKATNSAETMAQAVRDFVSNVKSHVETFFDEVDSTHAFFGDQQTLGISGYIARVKEAVAEVQSAVHDYFESMKILAGTSYTKADEEVKTGFSETNLMVENVIEDLGSTRWSSYN